MTAKQYLHQIYLAERKIKRLEERRRDYAAKLYSLGSVSGNTSDRVQVSPDPDVFVATIAMINDLDQEAVVKIRKLIDLKEQITNEIERLNNPRHVEILYYRYVCCLPWQVIAEKMCYSDPSPCFRIHGRALQNFEKSYPEKWS